MVGRDPSLSCLGLCQTVMPISMHSARSCSDPVLLVGFDPARERSLRLLLEEAGHAVRCVADTVAEPLLGLPCCSNSLARIIHELCIASLVLRLHTPFVALANTGSMWVGRRKAV